MPTTTVPGLPLASSDLYGTGGGGGADIHNGGGGGGRDLYEQEHKQHHDARPIPATARNAPDEDLALAAAICTAFHISGEYFFRASKCLGTLKVSGGLSCERARHGIRRLAEVID